LVEEVLMPEGRCAKCGSSDVTGAVDVVGGHGDGGPLRVVVEEKPEAWLFKGKVQSSLKAWVCGACGFTELYAQDPAALLAASRKDAEQGGGAGG
jgi:predicted nucleic-acid-binding Zn-ribbon protein